MRRRVAGFSVIEAMVALSIATAGLAVIFQLQHQLLNGQKRAEKVILTAEVQRNALVVIRDVNPLLEPEGEAIIPPGYTLTWISEPITEEIAGAGSPRGDGPFRLQLYRVDAELHAPNNGGLVHSFSVERVGWYRP